MAPMSKPSPLAFEWSIKSPQGFFSGESKAELVAHMEEIARRLSHGEAQIEFSYDTGAVIAKISAKISDAMSARANARARADTTSGLRGLLARALLFFHGLGAPERALLEKRLAADYLKEEQARVTQSLLLAFKTVLAQAEAFSGANTSPSTLR